MAEQKNPFASSLAKGQTRRRTAGESAGGPTTEPTGISAAEAETGVKRVSVDLPVELYKQAKVLAVQQGTTVKEMIGSALAKEVAARRTGQ